MAASAPSGPGELLPAAAINAVIKRVAASKGVSFATDARAAVVKAATMYIFMLMDDASDHAAKAKRAGISGTDIADALDDLGLAREAASIRARVEREREGRKQAAALRKRARESESDGGLESGAHRGSEAGEPRVEGSDRHDDSDAGDDEGEGSEADEPGSVAEAAWGGADA